MMPDTTMEDEAKLVEAWRGGDADAGDVLVDRNYDAIVRFFRTKTSVGVEDLVQKTFLVCAERLGTYEGVASFRAFLFGIARNVLFEHLRARTRDGRSDEAMGESSIVDLSPGVSTQVFRRAEHRALVEALQRIPLELQLVVELYYWEELGVDDLARVLDVPAGTVKSRLHRARALLRDALTTAPTTDNAWDARFRSLRPDVA